MAELLPLNTMLEILSAPMRMLTAHPVTDRFYASVGRALTLAVEFEHTCFTVALLANLRKRGNEAGFAFMADEKAVQDIFDRIEKKHLKHRLVDAYIAIPFEELRTSAEAGRVARNRLVHGLLEAHDVRIGEASGLTGLFQELLSLVTSIAIANCVMTQVFSALSGSAAAASSDLSEEVTTVVSWVLGSALASSESGEGAPEIFEAPNPAAQPDVQRTDVRRPRG
jgi:hypothetical protein